MKMYVARFIQPRCDVPLVPPCPFGKAFIAAWLPVSEYPRQPGLRFEEACFVIAASKNEVAADRETILNRRTYVCYDSHIRIKHEVRI